MRLLILTMPVIELAPSFTVYRAGSIGKEDVKPYVRVWQDLSQPVYIMTSQDFGTEWCVLRHGLAMRSHMSKQIRRLQREMQLPKLIFGNKFSAGSRNGCHLL